MKNKKNILLISSIILILLLVSLVYVVFNKLDNKEINNINSEISCEIADENGEFIEKKITYNKANLIPVETNIDSGVLFGKENIVVSKKILWGDIESIILMFKINAWNTNHSILPSTFIGSHKGELLGKEPLVEEVSAVLINNYGYAYSTDECKSWFSSCNFSLYRFTDNSIVSIETPKKYSTTKNGEIYISKGYIKLINKDTLEFLAHEEGSFLYKLRYSISKDLWTEHVINDEEKFNNQSLIEARTKNLSNYINPSYFREDYNNCFSYQAPGGDLVFIRHQLHDKLNLNSDRSYLFDMFYYKIK